MKIADFVLLAIGTLFPLVSFGTVLGDWRFEETPGFLADSGPGERNLTEEGSTVNPVALGGELGQAADIDGGYFTSPDEGLWTDSSMTVEVFFRADNAGAGSTQVLASQWDGTGDQRSWVVGLRSGKIRVMQSSDGAESVFRDVLAVSSGQDYYVAVIFNGESATVYLKDLSDDSEFTGSELTGMVETPHDSSTPFSIGATATPSSPFDGKIGRVRVSDEPLEREALLIVPPDIVSGPSFAGYMGIWFNLGQYTTYGPKYSGGFATYTAKHRPLAVYAEEVDKTFFTYGGTTGPNARHLVLMASSYDHANHLVPQPTLVMDKNGVDDPHDNSSIQLDKDGYVYVFVSGRSRSRPGFIFKSEAPYSTDSFERLSPAEGDEFTYPQIWYLPGTEDDGDELFFHLFTRYSDGRELYFATSADAITWTTARKFAALRGSYQTSNHWGNRVGTAFNRHPGGVDSRTDLYYIQSDDFGETWETVDGTPITLPVSDADSAARVVNYSAQGRLVYMKDLQFDANGYPVILYATSNDHRPGPNGEPRALEISHWIGTAWETTSMPPSATAASTLIHNYNTGSLHLNGDTWSVIAPTGAPESPAPGASQSELEHYWGQGGEMERWMSADHGTTWTKTMTLTRNSPRKHGYARPVQNGRDPFFVFWTDGNPESLSEAHLYFGNKDGSQYWALPYEMDADTAAPIPQKSAFLRWQERHLTPDRVTEGSMLEPQEDLDFDSSTNETEFIFGTDPANPVDQPGLSIQHGFPDRTWTLRHTFNSEALDYSIGIEASANLIQWDPLPGLTEIERTVLPDGRTFVEWQVPEWDADDVRKFYRLTAEPVR